MISDGTTTVFNMNDSRPLALDMLAEEFGHIDVHMLQYSGAIWYPMVYDMPARAKESFGTQKRQRGMDRCRQYIADAGATWVIPSAGRRASWIPNCATSTTTTAIPPTSSRTRWSSWSRCGCTATTADF